MAPELKAVSAAAALALPSSLNKNKVGVYLWNVSSIHLSLKGRTLGTELASTNYFKLSAVTVAKSFLNSSKVLNKTTVFSAALLAVPTSAEA